MDNETWILEAGESVIQKRIDAGNDALSPVEKLIYCLWVADYGMRNPGDLVTAEDLYPSFQSEAATAATQLNLNFTAETFLLSSEMLTKEYFERFDRVSDEIRSIAAR